MQNSSILRLAVVLRFSLACVAVSLLFTLLSWGQAEPHPFWVRHQYDPVELPLHLLKHGLLGAIISLPTRRLSFIAASGVVALLIDVDHVGLLGLPTVSRSTHSLGFIVLIMVAMGLLAHKGLLGKNVPPVLASAVSGAAVVSHIAVDIIDTQSGVPLWAPFTYSGLGLSAVSGAVLLGMGFMLVLVVAVWERRKAVGSYPDVSQPSRLLK
jgi:hypothetical protein